MVKIVVVAAAAAALVSAAPAGAQTPDGSLTDLTGVWVMMVEGHSFGLELEQKEQRIEGVMLAQGRRVLLVGDFVDRVLTLKGERPEDHAGLGHGGESDAKAGPIVATMKDDGTLEGELSTTRGRTRWTGERLKKR
ncbi:MAG: hypothetical protein AB7U83_20105 [Vicinamibacterales bacterium]